MDLGSARRPRAQVAVGLSLAVSLILALAPVSAQAATLSGAWKAKIGSAGANGTATIQAYTTGTGTLALKFAKMKPATTLPVVLHKGTCGSVGAVLLKLPSIKTTRAGAASRTTTLTAAQVTKINAAAKVGKIAIRIGSGTARKCGLFAAQPIPAYVATTITVGRGPAGAVVTPSGVWVTNFYDRTISRIDPVTNAVLQTFEVGSATVTETVLEAQAPEAIAHGEGSLWVSLLGVRYDLSVDPPSFTWSAGSIVRIDPLTGDVQATISVGGGAFDLEVTAGAIWVPLEGEGMVARIDPATNTVVASIPVPAPTAVAVGLGAVWVGSESGTVSRIDPATNSVVGSIRTQVTGGDVAIGAGAVWVSHRGHVDQADGSVSRIDPATNAVVANIVVGADPRQIAFAGGHLWVGLNDAPTVVQVAGPVFTAAKPIAVPAPVYAIAATDHAVWAVHEDEDEVTRINY